MSPVNAAVCSARQLLVLAHTLQLGDMGSTACVAPLAISPNDAQNCASWTNCDGQTFLFVGTIRKCLHRFGAVWWVRTDTRTLTYVCVRTRVALTLRVIPKAALLNCDSPVCSQRVR